MKSILVAASIIALASAASAADFDSNSVTLQFNRDNIVSKLNVTAGEATDVSVGAYILPHSVLGADADVFVEANYGIVTEDLTFGATYDLQKNVSDKTTVYGTVEAAYTVASGSTAGAWEVTPLVGASYAVNDKLAAFGEVSYAFDASNDWNRVGGVVEIGADYSVTDGVYVRPSITHTFDTATDETNAALTIGLAF